jgi:hypothetical protein
MTGKKTKWILAVGALSLTLWLSNAIQTRADGGTTAQSGSIDDPLVTKSYIDQRMGELVKQEVAAQLKLNPQATATVAPTPTATPSPTPASAGLTVVELKIGQTLYAAAGTELIVRSGKVLAVSNDENGIPDVTSGTDISANSAIQLNHLLIFPREGRGIKPDPKNQSDIFVMVRGNYTIYNADGTMATP